MLSSPFVLLGSRVTSIVPLDIDTTKISLKGNAPVTIASTLDLQRTLVFQGMDT
jgi:hypothetical protein